MLKNIFEFWKKKLWKKFYNIIYFEKKNFLYTFFFVLKSSETYAKKILSSALFDGGEEGSKILAWFLAPVQEASIAAKELFRLSEFCTCLTELLCLTTAPFRMYRFRVAIPELPKFSRFEKLKDYSCFQWHRTVFWSKWMMSTMNTVTNSWRCTVVLLGASKVYQKTIFGWILLTTETLGVITMYPR